jgi:cobalamin biosynthesis Mg chelatase CobN
MLSTLHVPGLAARRLITALLGALALIAAVLLTPTAALAHGGPFDLAVASDGAGGLVVTAVYQEDGHAVSEIIDPVATAVAADGTTAGPVALVSSAEGEGIWVTPEPFLGPGEWSVTVATTAPSAATATVAVTVAELAPPIEPGESIPAGDDTEGSGDAAESGEVADGAETGTPGPAVALWIVAGVVVLAVVAGLVILLVRRRSLSGVK